MYQVPGLVGQSVKFHDSYAEITFAETETEFANAFEYLCLQSARGSLNHG